MKTYKIEVKRPTHTQTIFDDRLSVIADIAGLAQEEIEWAIEEHGHCEFAWPVDNAEARITEHEVAEE